MKLKERVKQKCNLDLIVMCDGVPESKGKSNSKKENNKGDSGKGKSDDGQTEKPSENTPSKEVKIPKVGHAKVPEQPKADRVLGAPCTAQDLQNLHATKGVYIDFGIHTKKCATSANGALPAVNNCSCAARGCVSGYHVEHYENGKSKGICVKD